MVMTAESMHEITGSNPAVMHLFSYCFENSIYAYVLLYTLMKYHNPVYAMIYRYMSYILLYTEMNILYQSIY